MLCELANSYKVEALRLRAVLSGFRQSLQSCTDPELRSEYRHKIAVITDIQRQCYELAELCKRYYDRDYYRNPGYTSNGWGGD